MLMLKLTFNYSKLDEMENSRAIYKINGKQQDPLTILKGNGVNYVRLRFWVDPGKQNLPKAWQNQSFEQLNSTVYSYTADVLNQMKEKGIYPDMVKIGNELNSGMLWSCGKSWGGDGKEFTRLATFLKSGVQAVKDTQQSTPKNYASFSRRR